MTVGGLNVVKVFRTDDYSQVAVIPVGNLPHGIWPSGDGSRVYVGLEHSDALSVIDTLTNTVIATVRIGQAPQALNYVSNAVPEGDGMSNLQPLGVAGQVVPVALVPIGATAMATSVSLFDQGLLQVLQAAVTGLDPLGQIRQVVAPDNKSAADKRRYLVIATSVSGKADMPVQVQKL